MCRGSNVPEVACTSQASTAYTGMYWSHTNLHYRRCSSWIRVSGQFCPVRKPGNPEVPYCQQIVPRGTECNFAVLAQAELVPAGSWNMPRSGAKKKNVSSGEYLSSRHISVGAWGTVFAAKRASCEGKSARGTKQRGCCSGCIHKFSLLCKNTGSGIGQRSV